MPPLKLNVAVGTPPLCEALVAVPTRVTARVPPFRLTTPTLPSVLPAALREMSRVAQLIAPELAIVTTPVPRLARKKLLGSRASPTLSVPPVTVTVDAADGLPSETWSRETAFSVPPDWLMAATVFAAVPVLRRAAIVSVPFTMFNVAGAPATTPMRELLAPAVLDRMGALEPWPKLNVPLRTSNCTGVVIGAAAGLSTSVQLALLLTLRMLVIEFGSTAPSRLVSVPVPASVNVDRLAVFVTPPPRRGHCRADR